LNLPYLSLTYPNPPQAEENSMRPIIRPVAAALSIGGLAMSLVVVSSTGAFAQAKQAPPANQAAPSPADAPIKQIVLTDKQIEAVLASQKDMDAITEKLPEDTKPDPKVVAQLDAVAKKYGFADYADYNTVVENLSLVLGGFDPQTKKYIGIEAVTKQQIAAVEADKKMSAKDKKEALADLNESLKTPAPAVENKGNIDLVEKYYDKLAAAMSTEE
jgi:hypothetical protein